MFCSVSHENTIGLSSSETSVEINRCFKANIYCKHITRQAHLYVGSDGDPLPFEALPIAMQPIAGGNSDNCQRARSLAIP